MQFFIRNATALSHQSLFNFIISCEYANMAILASTINMLLEDAHFYTYRTEKIIAKGKRDAEYALLIENAVQ
jgi:hypothetical protein